MVILFVINSLFVLQKQYTYKKKTKCVGEWCELLKMPTSTFYNRIKRGWSIDEIIETPIRKINGTFVKDE